MCIAPSLPHLPEDLAAVTRRVPWLGLRMVATPASVFAAEWTFMVASQGWARPALQAWLPLIDACFVTAWTFTVATLLVLWPLAQAWRGHRAELMVERGRVQEGIERQELEGRMRRGLGMARDEQQAVSVLARGLRSACEGHSTTLLLADSSQAHLELTPMKGSEGDRACSVDCPMDCPAARSGRTQVFDDPRAVDACPFLLDRALSCAPVSASGRVVGVVQLPGQALQGSQLAKVELVAREFGTRLGVLRAMAAAERAASRDPLTGLLNRRSFEEQASRRLAEQPLSSTVICDIDHFKKLNDTYGHAVGDRALTVFARLLHDHFDQHGLVARYGGEEFLVLLPSLGSQQAAELTEQLREHLSDRCMAAGVPALTASFGVSDTQAAGDLQGMVRAADEALYVAKRSGRDRVEVAQGAATSEPRVHQLTG